MLSDFLDAGLSLGVDLFDEGRDTLVPLVPQRHDGCAMFTAFPRVLSDWFAQRHIATTIDATRVGGHYLSAVLPHEVEVKAQIFRIR